MASTKSVEVRLSCPYGQFYSFFKTQANLLPQPYVAGAIVSSIKLYGSTTSWVDTKGSQKSVTFQTGPGASESFVDEVEAVDDAAQKIIFKILQGDLLTYYKTFTVEFQVTNANTAKWTATYEKISPESGDPIEFYLSLLRAVSVGINSYLSH